MRKILLLLCVVLCGGVSALGATNDPKCCPCPPPKSAPKRAQHKPQTSCKPCAPCAEVKVPDVIVNVTPTPVTVTPVVVAPTPAPVPPEIRYETRNVFIPEPRHGEWSLPVSALYLHDKAAGAVGLDYEWANGFALSGQVIAGSALDSSDIVRSTLIHETTTVRVCGLGGGHHDNDDHGDDGGGGSTCTPGPPVTRRTVTSAERGSRDETSRYGFALTLRIPLRRR